MENTELKSTFELIDNIEFEDKVDIEDLVSHSEPTGIPNLETIGIKEEPLKQICNTMASYESNKLEEFLMVHERINSSSFATVSDKNEVFQPEIVLRQSGVLPSKPVGSENEVFQSEIEKEIVKLFGEFDMMTLYDYDQTRVRKVKELVEKYQTITQKVIVKLHEKTLEVKTNELDRIKEELQMAKSTNLTLSKRIEELEKERNQVSGQKPSLKSVKNMLKTHNKTSHGRSKQFVQFVVLDFY